MHWIIQDGFFNETGMNDLVRILGQLEIPYTIVKVIPFIGEILPDVSPEGRVICFGSYSMRHMAKRKHWYPGVFDLEDVSDAIFDQDHVWHPHLLNDDLLVCLFKNAVKTAVANFGLHDFFMRPVSDSKVFAGNVFSIEEVREWIHNVVILEEDDGSSLCGDTLVVVSSPKNIQAEYRLFVIGDKIVTASQYKRNGRIQYDALVDNDILVFGQERVNEIHLADAYCLDICRTNFGLKIVEVNTINSAGFYLADVYKLVEQFELLYSIPSCQNKEYLVECKDNTPDEWTCFCI